MTGVGVGEVKENDLDCFRFFIHRFKVFPGLGVAVAASLTFEVSSETGTVMYVSFALTALTAAALIGVKGPSTVCQLGVPPLDGVFINRVFNLRLNASELGVLEFEYGLTITPSEAPVGLP